MAYLRLYADKAVQTTSDLFLSYPSQNAPEPDSGNFPLSRRSQLPYQPPPHIQRTNRRLVSFPGIAHKKNIVPQTNHRIVSLPSSIMHHPESPSMTQETCHCEHSDVSFSASSHSYSPQNGLKNASSGTFPLNVITTPSPPSSPETVFIVDDYSSIANQYPHEITSRKAVNFKNETGSVSSPPRPIPALHGPPSLPYARCPSGAEGTIIEDADLPRIIWGLEIGDSRLPQGNHKHITSLKRRGQSYHNSSSENQNHDATVFREVSQPIDNGISCSIEARRSLMNGPHRNNSDVHEKIPPRISHIQPIHLNDSNSNGDPTQRTDGYTNIRANSEKTAIHWDEPKPPLFLEPHAQSLFHADYYTSPAMKSEHQHYDLHRNNISIPYTAAHTMHSAIPRHSVCSCHDDREQRNLVQTFAHGYPDSELVSSTFRDGFHRHQLAQQEFQEVITTPTSMHPQSNLSLRQLKAENYNTFSNDLSRGTPILRTQAIPLSCLTHQLLLPSAEEHSKRQNQSYRLASCKETCMDDGAEVNANKENSKEVLRSAFVQSTDPRKAKEDKEKENVPARDEFTSGKKIRKRKWRTRRSVK